MLNKTIFITVSLLTLQLAIAAEDIPKEFQGKWGKQSAPCENIAMEVTNKKVTLINASDKLSFSGFETCLSCEGGAKYSGIVVWLMPDMNAEKQAPFSIRFNDGEKKGIAVIDFEDKNVSKRFPNANSPLKKCAK